MPILKLKSIFKKAYFRLFCLKHNDLRKICTNTYNLNLAECTFHYSSNMIIEFDNNGEKKFFRMSRMSPGKKHLKTFVIETIDLFFTLNRFENHNNSLNSIKNDLDDKSNFNKLKKIPIFYKEHFYDMCARKMIDFSLLGLPSLNQFNFKGEHIHFIQFLRSSIELFNSSKNFKNGCLINISANRIMSTRIVAELLGLEHLVPKSEVCQIYLGNTCFYGTAMSEANGFSPALKEIDERMNCDSFFEKNLASLEYFDYLCYQTDRRLDNFFVSCCNGTIHSLSAFDNDQPNTFFSVPFLPNKLSIQNSPIVKKRRINRPFIDIKTFEAITSINKKILYNSLSTYLTKIQVECLFRRIKTMQKALINSKKTAQVFNGCYYFNCSSSIKTYLSNYYSDRTLLDRIKKYGG